MDVKNDISEELRALSALVASISRETPYRVPEGYFSTFPALVAQKVAKPLTFTVPEGYFEGFAAQVLNRIKTGSVPSTSAGEKTGSELSKNAVGADELPAILMQAGARVMPYSVPEDYFEGLSPVLAVLREKNPFSVPEGYFEGLAGKISGTIAAREPVAETQPQNESKNPGTAKVVSFSKQRNWLKYSAAAVVAGLILTAGWLRLHPSTDRQNVANAAGTGTVPVELAKVSDQDLQSFLVDQDTTLAQPEPISGNTATAALDMSDTDMKNLLGDVPDGELKQYMEEHGGANDIATN